MNAISKALAIGAGGCKIENMSDDRKYKQHGYQEPESRPKPGSSPQRPGEKRAPAFTAYREMMHCDACGAQLGKHFEISFNSRCPKCRANLHTCRNCLNLDPSGRFECTQTVEKRVENKRASNRCALFEARRVRVKETSFSTTPSRDDARKAMESLFKKKK